MITKNEEIILKLIELTQDKEIIWKRKYKNYDILYRIIIDDLEFVLFSYAKTLHLISYPKGFDCIIAKEKKSDDGLLNDLLGAITYKEEMENKKEQREAFDETYKTIMERS